MKNVVNDEKKKGANEPPEQNSSVSCSSSGLPCMDKLREELSCAVRIFFYDSFVDYFKLTILVLFPNNFNWV